MWNLGAHQAFIQPAAHIGGYIKCLKENQVADDKTRPSRTKQETKAAHFRVLMTLWGVFPLYTLTMKS